MGSVKAKMTAEQKQANKVERKRQSLEDRNYAEVGGRNSLFAELAQPVSTVEAEWHMRRTKALMCEHLHHGPASVVTHALQTFVVISGIETEARRLLGDELFGKLRARCHETFGSHTYWYSFWKKVLTTTEEQVLGWVRIEDATKKLGCPVEPAGTFPPAGWVPPLTSDEFYKRWPFRVYELGPEPEGMDELFASVREKLTEVPR